MSVVGAVGNEFGALRLPDCTELTGADFSGAGGGGDALLSKPPTRELWQPAKMTPAAAMLSKLAFEIPIWFSNFIMFVGPIIRGSAPRTVEFEDST
ncbi:hypothetical protein D9M69_615410 [compost metagenome]